MRYKEKHYKRKALGCIALGMPLAASGALLCATIYLAPIGLVLLLLSGLPLATQQIRFMRRREEWQRTRRPTHSEAPPWLMDDELVNWQNDRTEPDA